MMVEIKECIVGNSSRVLFVLSFEVFYVLYQNIQGMHISLK